MNAVARPLDQLSAALAGEPLRIQFPPQTERNAFVLLGDGAMQAQVADTQTPPSFYVGQRRLAVIYGGEDVLFKGEISIDGVDANGAHLAVTGALTEESDRQFWHRLWSRHHSGAGARAAAPALPRIPGKNLYTEQARRARVDFLHAQTGVRLAPAGSARLAAEMLRNNTEGFVGSIEVPVGVAGPLRLHRGEGSDLVYAPIATTEGALIASISRGAAALSQSGGVRARAIRQRVARTPVFAFASVDDALFFAGWVEGHMDQIRAQTRLASQHAQLLSVDVVVVGRQAHADFVYRSGDAAGQNMVTACTWRACQWILEKLRAFPDIAEVEFFIDANLSSDKKASAWSFVRGRGTRVVAEATLDAHAIRRVLKVDPQRLMACYRTCRTGSAAGGMFGFCVHPANTLAGIFTATGQDIACVHESSLAMLELESREDDAVYASLTLPCLMVGTVGGGTGLPQQRQYLELMGCYGDGKAARFAEIVAAFALAGELSLLAAFAAGEFAQAHERMGRNRPVRDAVATG